MSKPTKRDKQGKHRYMSAVISDEWHTKKFLIYIFLIYIFKALRVIFFLSISKIIYSVIYILIN